MNIDNMVTQAKLAQKHWQKIGLAERINVLQQYAQLLQVNETALVQLICEEIGKPRWEAKTEVQSAIAKVAISINAYQTRTGTVTLSETPVHSEFTHKPIGVFAVLGPYNFPLHLPNGHIVPALLAGNSVLFKPSRYAPRIAKAMVDLWQQAGLPVNVLQLLLLDRQQVQEVLNHEAINGVLFTGSYQAGQQLHKQFAGKVDKLLALEMGGNNPLIVWDVKNLQAAAYHTILSSYISAGQRCTCARRLIIQDNAQGEQFLTALIQQIKQMKIGLFTEDPEPFMGPVISKMVAEELLTVQEKLLAQGGNGLVLMQQMANHPALLTPGLMDVTDIKPCKDEEYFGPLLQVYRVKDFAAALAQANQTCYGLAAGLFSDNQNLFNVFMDEIRAGVVNINRQLTGASSQAPFGGIGFSGNHRPSAYYAADYCAYPVASMREATLQFNPQLVLPGIKIS